MYKGNMSAVVESDGLLIELIRQEEFLRGQLVIVERLKKYILEHSKAPCSVPGLGDELDEILRCTENLSD